MPTKVLLTNLTTTRNKKRVTFKAGETVELTKDELSTLDDLATKTRKPQYRNPANEIVNPASVESEEDESEDEGEGEDEMVDLDSMNVKALKAYLDENEVEYDADALKADLLAAAKEHRDGGL